MPRSSQHELLATKQALLNELETQSKILRKQIEIRAFKHELEMEMAKRAQVAEKIMATGQFEEMEGGFNVAEENMLKEKREAQDILEQQINS